MTALKNTITIASSTLATIVAENGDYTGWAKKVSLIIFAITSSTASQFS